MVLRIREELVGWLYSKAKAQPTDKVINFESIMLIDAFFNHLFESHQIPKVIIAQYILYMYIDRALVTVDSDGQAVRLRFISILQFPFPIPVSNAAIYCNNNAFQYF